ncbi:oligosaccharide flippase family protein [Caldicellulosiruptor sp. F32]|uniref:oligosaccharide flippase family protein n=1 Tax=Caldicellulosiruptor sp. F32 TaxID=1214564 RepID=UPI00039BC3FF|nr:oligosaccharide flippase family protein [Caldicellulosiruptor sp. F32]
MNKKIINQILTLTLCNILTYSLFFFYRVFISRQIGSVGMGLYTFGMTLYYLFYNISSGGILTAISKYIAETSDLPEIKIKTAFVMSRIIFLWSIVIAIFFSLLNPIFCNTIFNTPILQKTIYPLIICTVVVSQSAILKGFFYGIQNPAPPALAEVFENIMRLSIICPLFLSLDKSASFETKLLLTFLGILLGEISSCGFLIAAYKIKCSKNRLKIDINELAEIPSKIFKISIPLATIGVLGMIFQSLENMIIPKLFELIGMKSTQAISVYGIINGMSFPAALLPLVIINSLSTIIIPTISEIKMYNKTLNSRINYFILATLIVSLPITCIFLLYPVEICQLLYKNQLAGVYLKHISPAIVFYYLSVTLSSILNALGEVIFNFVQNTILTIIRLVLYVLLILVIKNELPYIWITNIFALISCIVMIEKISNLKFKFTIEKGTINTLLLLMCFCLFIMIVLLYFRITNIKIFIPLFLSGYAFFVFVTMLYQKWRKKN